MKIENTTPLTVTDLWSRISADVGKAKTLEQAAQLLARTVYEQFEESVVVARVFATVAQKALPERIQEFARGLAGTADAVAALGDDTPVLALLGTHGVEPDWCDRHRSKGHLGIPLITSAFVEGIPMIARLLHELGIPLDWVDSHDSDVIQRTVGKSEGLFFVRDAKQATDAKGRKVIAAQDFVERYGVASVFGVGAVYPTDQILVLVAFCRDRFSRETAEHFVPLAGLFKSETRARVAAGRIFAS